MLRIKEIKSLKEQIKNERLENERLRGEIKVLRQSIEETAKRLKNLSNFDDKV